MPKPYHIHHKSANRTRPWRPLRIGKELPNKYTRERPITVFQSETVPNTVIIMMALKEKGRRVLVALHTNKQVTGRIVTHDIRSVYGKDSVSAMNDWGKHGMLLYANQTKNRSLPRGTGLQLPLARLAKNGRSAFKTEEDLASFIKNATTIAQPGSIVNKKTEAPHTAAKKRFQSLMRRSP